MVGRLQPAWSVGAAACRMPASPPCRRTCTGASRPCGAPAAARQPGPLRLIQLIDAQRADLRGGVGNNGRVAGPASKRLQACRRNAGGGRAGRPEGGALPVARPLVGHALQRRQGGGKEGAGGREGGEGALLAHRVLRLLGERHMSCGRHGAAGRGQQPLRGRSQLEGGRRRAPAAPAARDH